MKTLLGVKDLAREFNLTDIELVRRLERDGTMKLSQFSKLTPNDAERVRKIILGHKYNGPLTDVVNPDITSLQEIADELGKPVDFLEKFIRRLYIDNYNSRRIHKKDAERIRWEVERYEIATERSEREKAYEQLLDSRARLTERLIRLNENPLTKLRSPEKIVEIDAERAAIHQEIKKLGDVLGKNEIQVMMEILARESKVPQLDLPGITLLPYREEDPDRGTGEEIEGLFLVYNTEFYYATNHGEGHNSLHNAEAFNQFLDEHGAKLLKHLQMQYPNYAIREVNQEKEQGYIHDFIFSKMKGIFLPPEIAEIAVSWVRQHPESWMTEEAYKEHYDAKREHIDSFQQSENDELLDHYEEVSYAFREIVDGGEAGRVKAEDELNDHYENVSNEFRESLNPNDIPQENQGHVTKKESDEEHAALAIEKQLAERRPTRR